MNCIPLLNKDVVVVVVVVVAIIIINTGKRTEWSPIQSVIIRMITKLAGVRFVNPEYDYRLTSDHAKSSYELIIKITIFEKHKK